MLEPRELFDEAFLGYGYRPGDPCEVAIYDREVVVGLFAREMSWEDAEEHVSFNVEGSWCGPGTPMILNRCTAAQFDDLCC